MRTMKFNVLILLVSCMGLLFIQCEEDDDTTQTQGQLQLEMTDAPIDNANVESAIVTVAEIRVDGETYNGLNEKVTFDLLAYQQGEVKSLGTGNMEVGSYNEIELIFDTETDANGQSPGCYVMTEDDQKIDLAGHLGNQLTVKADNESFDVAANQTTNLVIDVNLRKAITEDQNQEDSYAFVTEAEMQEAVRVVHKNESGAISGNCNEVFSDSDQIVVYAYQKGTFNMNEEFAASGESNIRFKGAVTSSKVDGQGNYTLAFLEAEAYELVFVSYKDEDFDGRYEVQGMLEVNSLLDLDLSDIQVQSGLNLQVDVTVTGLIPV